VAPVTTPSLDARRFTVVATVDGEVSEDTVFEYQERDGEVWASYSGGAVRAAPAIAVRFAGAIRPPASSQSVWSI
jgi:hypothetical protein